VYLLGADPPALSNVLHILGRPTRSSSLPESGRPSPRQPQSIRDRRSEVAIAISRPRTLEIECRAARTPKSVALGIESRAPEPHLGIECGVPGMRVLGMWGIEYRVPGMCINSWTTDRK
jgi:hypothetical protein